MYFQRLRDLREDRDLLQRDIAKILGITQTVYSRYERGATDIPTRHLVVLCDFFNVSSDYLLGIHLDSRRKRGTPKYNLKRK